MGDSDRELHYRDSTRVESAHAQFLPEDDFETSTNATSKSRSKKRRKAYYRPDPEPEEGAEEAASVIYQPPKYELGYDVNILVSEVHRNTIRKIVLDDSKEHTGHFTDYEMITLAYALKHNTSVHTLILRALPCTDSSLVPLFEGLVEHPALRVLEVSALNGKGATAKALVTLVTTNRNIIQVTVTECCLTEQQAEAIDVAAQYNLLGAPDPQRNAFDAEVVDSVNDLPYFARKFARRSIEVGDRPICAAYVGGQCKFGSRCLLLHPMPSTVPTKGKGKDDGKGKADGGANGRDADEDDDPPFTMPRVAITNRKGVDGANGASGRGGLFAALVGSPVLPAVVACCCAVAVVVALKVS